jgi:hypothetical protein
VAMIESNSPTKHPSAPLLLQVAANKQASDANQGQLDESKEPASGSRSPSR